MLCEAFVNNAGGFGQSFNSAMRAGNASGPLRSDWANAPRGAIHYWAGVGGDGHVAFELDERPGSSLLLMASASVDDRWGGDMGTVSFQRYARFGIPYRGWTLRHGAETLAPITRPTPAAAPAAAAPQEDDLPTTSQVWDEPQSSLNGNAPSVVIRDANIAAQSAAAAARDIAWINHRGVDAPIDVVLADGLIGTQQSNVKLDALGAAVTALAGSLGADPAKIEAAVDRAVREALSGTLTVSSALSEADLAGIARAVQDEQDRRTRARLAA